MNACDSARPAGYRCIRYSSIHSVTHLIACRETIRKVERLHVWDVARANKAPFAFGIEPRVPFLDKAFLQTSMSIDPQDKMVRKLTLLLLNLTPSPHSLLSWCKLGKHITIIQHFDI